MTHSCPFLRASSVGCHAGGRHTLIHSHTTHPSSFCASVQHGIEPEPTGNGKRSHSSQRCSSVCVCACVCRTSLDTNTRGGWTIKGLTALGGRAHHGNILEQGNRRRAKWSQIRPRLKGHVLFALPGYLCSNLPFYRAKFYCAAPA